MEDLLLRAAQTGTESNSVPLLHRIKTYGVMIFLYFASVTAFAETPLKNSFDTAEMKMMAEANLSYSSCLQEHAREHVASSPDIRIIAGNAAEACNPVLAELENTLTDRGVNPRFLHGGGGKDKEPGNPACIAAADDGEIEPGSLSYQEAFISGSSSASALL